jgi:hypothetical protein
MDGICLIIALIVGVHIIHLMSIGIVLNIGQIGHLIIHSNLIIMVGIGLIGGGITLGGMGITTGIMALGIIQVTM